ncbi:MAG: flagellar biosynthetic protein FliO [Oscillospiraceae bacterium]|jgi:flagellar protein FliO/FliZ|nr:flagellar biosynthetic protein FliO [Oscillospiraceae bacterium]
MGELPGRLPRIALTLLDGLDSLFSLIWLLICVLVVVVLAYLFTRYVAGRGGGMAGLSGASERFKVLSRLSLGREQGVMLVKAGEKFLLLGVTPAGITLLKELTQEEADAICPPPDPDLPPPPSFGEALRTVLKQKKPR